MDAQNQTPAALKVGDQVIYQGSIHRYSGWEFTVRALPNGRVYLTEDVYGIRLTVRATSVQPA